MYKQLIVLRCSKILNILSFLIYNQGKNYIVRFIFCRFKYAQP